MTLNIVKIRAHERGFLFKNLEFVRTLGPGWHAVPGSWLRGRVDCLSVREPFVSHADLDVLRKVGAFGDEATVLDLKDNERALVWVDGRLAKILKPGLHAVWTVFQEARIEVIDARVVRVAPELVAAVSQLQGRRTSRRSCRSNPARRAFSSSTDVSMRRSVPERTPCGAGSGA